MLCIFYIFMFGILGLFSASHRKLFFESIECVKNSFTRQPCETDVEQKVKTSVTHSIFQKSPWVAKQVNNHFRLISWTFVVLTVLTGFLTIKAGYDLLVHGTCTPGAPENCTVSQSNEIIQFFKGVVR